MAVTQTPRLGLTKWSAGSDPFARSQMNTDADALELLAAIDAQGTFAARPAAGVRGRYYWSTDKFRLYRDDGAAWQDSMDPAGALKMTAGAILATGWLWCDGATYDRATYPDLFTALGGTNSPWGLPSGTTFKVPDLRGRAPYGAGTAGAGLTARALGALFGVETVALTSGQMPGHAHTVNSHSHGGATSNTDVNHQHWMQHNHGTDSQGAHKHAVGGSYGFVIGFRTDAGANGLQSGGERMTFTDMSTEGSHGHNIDNGWRNYTDFSATSIVHSHPVSAEAPGTNSQGGGSAHENMSPGAGVNFMIRT